MSAYAISIAHCNTIERADISITKGCLNIKYGPNGIGKSTIAKAILAACNKDGTLNNLLPFKHRGAGSTVSPEVSGIDGIESVLVFDEKYVSQFVFQRDEVVKNSFDIFINTEEFRAAIEEIEDLFSGIKDAFKKNVELEKTISDLKELRDAFVITKSGSISKASKGFKAFGSGNKIENIPPALTAYSDFIRSEQPSKWIAWQAKGNDFLDISDNCPYCSSSLKEGAQKDTAKLVAAEYDSKSVEYLNSIQAIIQNIGHYFSPDCREILDKIIKTKIELSPEETNFLANLRGDVETLLGKLESLRSISFFSLRDVAQIEDEIKRLVIDLALLKNLSSDETKAVVDPINAQLTELEKTAGALKGKINKHKSQIAKTITENQTHINGFLQSAGYKYRVEIKAEADSYKMKLVHEDHDNHIETASEHLSYGERNAFALVLFMHQALRENPDLAILDDPVSSFDKTKKFAIIHQLFRGKESLRDITTLMLTHDLEPAIDIVKVSRRDWNNSDSQLPSAYFLSSKSGEVFEQEITPADIKTFSAICKENISSIDDEIIKCIYLRRHFEILGTMELEYNLLSSLLHGRDVPTVQEGTTSRDMTAEEITEASTSIQREFPGFDYPSILSQVIDSAGLQRRFTETSVGYEKLQLFRIFTEVTKSVTSAHDSRNILRKFVNESFHIENEYVMQLNPHKFDNVPEHVVLECAECILERQSSA